VLPPACIDGLLVMRPEHATHAPVELLEVGKTAAGPKLVLQHTPEACNRIEVVAGSRWPELQPQACLTDDTEHDAAGDLAPGAIASPGVAFEGLLVVDGPLAQGTSGPPCVRCCAPPAGAGQSTAPQDRVIGIEQVPHPGQQREDRGWLLMQGYEATRDEHYLEVRDAATLEVVARVWTGQHFPLGFHINFTPASCVST